MRHCVERTSRVGHRGITRVRFLVATCCVAGLVAVEAQHARAQLLVDGLNSAPGASSSALDAAHFQNSSPNTFSNVYVGHGANGPGYMDNTSSLTTDGVPYGGAYDTTGNWGLGVGSFSGAEGYFINAGAGSIDAREIRVGDGFGGALAKGEFYHTSSGAVTSRVMTVGNASGDGKYVASGTGAITVHSQAYIGTYGSVGTTTGTFIQEGGDVTFGDVGMEYTDEFGYQEMFLGFDTNSTGHYDLQAGTLTVNGWSNIGRDGGVGTFDNAGTFSMTGDLRVGISYGGAGGNGTFVNHPGGTVSANGYLLVGYGTGAVGSVTQSGATSSMTIASVGAETELYVGFGSGASATFDLQGGTVTVAGWTNIGRDLGIGVFNNQGSFTTTQELRVGVTYDDTGGDGEFNNLAGGSVHAGSNDTIPAITIGGGFQGGAVGRFKQHGAGASVVADGWIVVGDTGTGTLEESTGTILVEDNLFVGHNEGSHGTWIQSGGVNTISGIYPTFTGNFYVGNAGLGDVTQTGGDNLMTTTTATAVPASVSMQNAGDLSESVDGNLVIGSAVTGVGTFVHSGGTNSIASNLEIGVDGDGTYTLSGTGAVRVGQHTAGGDLLLAANAGSKGTFNLQGGSLYVTGGNGMIAAGLGTAAFNFTGGTLRVVEFNPALFGGDLGGLTQNGATSLLDVTANNTKINGPYNLTSGTATIGASRTLTVTGAVSVGATGVLGGSGQLIAPSTTVAAGGILSPGSSVGTLEVQGDVVLDGTLKIEYDGTADTVDLLNVSGLLDIAGSSVAFTNIGGGTLGGGAHVIASYGTLLGTFIPSGLPAGYSLNYNFLGGNDIALVPDNLLLGDVNFDGVVDIFDVNVVSDNWGDTGAPGITGDANSDGTVDIFDVNTISDHWGEMAGMGAVSTVPEPGSLALAGVALVAGYGVWRRSNRRRP